MRPFTSFGGDKGIRSACPTTMMYAQLCLGIFVPPRQNPYRKHAKQRECRSDAVRTRERKFSFLFNTH